MYYFGKFTVLPLALVLIPGLLFYFPKTYIQLLIYPKHVRKLLGYISGCYNQSSSVLKNMLTSITSFNRITFVLTETAEKKRLLIVMSSDIIPFAFGNIGR